ncbi:hypothetical protein [Streptomyces sp. NPDC088736]|uniref:hypothetical protein n=1 Tax=Streptomyces sp. NPDC088736 TaxID=3365881 RepID=UPI00380B7210
MHLKFHSIVLLEVDLVEYVVYPKLLVVVETDGAFEHVDSLKAEYEGVPGTNGERRFPPPTASSSPRARSQGWPSHRTEVSLCSMRGELAVVTCALRAANVGGASRPYVREAPQIPLRKPAERGGGAVCRAVGGIDVFTWPLPGARA